MGLTEAPSPFPHPPLLPEVSASPINPLGLGFLPPGSACLVPMGQLRHPLLCVLVGGLWSRTGERLTKAERTPTTHCHTSLCLTLKPEPLQARRFSYLLQQWRDYDKIRGPQWQAIRLGDGVTEPVLSLRLLTGLQRLLRPSAELEVERVGRA